MTSVFAQLMPTSLDALSNLNLIPIASMGVLVMILIFGVLTLRSEPSDPFTDSDPENSAARGSDEDRVDLKESLQNTQSELREATEEAELTLLQLHQVQKDLEQVFLQKQASDNEANKLKQQLAALESALQTSHNSKNSEKDKAIEIAKHELKEARAEAELTLLQLQQVQEELEHYFLLSREQSAMLDAHTKLQKRAQKVLTLALRKCSNDALLK